MLSAFVWPEEHTCNSFKNEHLRCVDFISECSLILYFSRETNLKVKQALPETAEIQDDMVKWGQFDGKFTFEPHH